MAWQLEFSDLARKNLGDLDRQTAIRILRFLNERVAGLENPRDLGEPLKGSTFATLWRYRVGAYRVVADIQNDRLRILVVRNGHRRGVYMR